MRKLLFCLMAWVIGTASVLADNVVTLTSGSGKPDQEVTVSVDLANTDAVSAVQIEMPLPTEGLSYVEGSAVLNTDRKADHALSVSRTATGIRLVIYSLGLKNLQGSNGEVCSLRLKLQSEPGAYNLIPAVTLTSSEGLQLGCQIKGVKISVYAPKIELGQTLLDFGRNATHKLYTQTLTLRNTGTRPLHISKISVSGTTFSLSQTSMTLRAGEESDISVTYAPTGKDSSEEILTIESDAVNGNQTANLKAQAYTVNELHLEGGYGQSDEELTITMRINNMEAISAVQCSMMLPEELEYVEGSAISAHSTHTAYSSYKEGKLTLMLYSPANQTIAEGSSNLMSFRLRLTGTSGIYQLNPLDVVLGNNVLENVVSAAYGTEVQIISPHIEAESVLSFGTCDIDKTANVDFEIGNSGKVALTVTNIAFKDQGYSIITPLPMTIGVGENKTITLSYAPTTEGTANSSFNIYTNDPEQRSLTVSTTAEVVAPNNLSLGGTISGKDLTATINISLDNYSDISAMQMDLICAEGLSLNNSDVNGTDRMSNHVLYLSKQSDNEYRLAAYSLTNQAVSGKNGEVLTLTLRADKPKNLYGDLLTISNIRLGGTDGKNKTTQTKLVYTNDSTYIEDYDPQTNTSTTRDNFIVSSLSNEDGTELEAATVGGENNVLTIALNGGKDDNERRYTAFNLDMSLPFGLEVSTENGELEVGLPANYSLYAARLNQLNHSVAGNLLANNTLRVVCSSNANSSFKKAKGDAFELLFKINSPYVKPGINNIHFSGLNLTTATDGHKYVPEDYDEEITVEEGEVSISLNIPETTGYTTTVLPFDATVPEGLTVFECTKVTNGEACLTPVDKIEAYTPYVVYANGGWQGEISGNLSAAKYEERVDDNGFVTNGCLSGVVRPQLVNEGYLLQGEIFTKITETTSVSPGRAWINVTGLSEDVLTIPRYTVHFVLDEYEQTSIQLYYGQKIETPASLKKEGYTISWEANDMYMPASDTIVTGYYIANIHQITYILDGVTFKQENLEFGHTITPPTIENLNEGYTFLGWVNCPATMPDEDLLISGSTTNKYTVSYYVVGNLYYTQSVEYGSHIDKPDLNVDKRYRFNGWTGEDAETMPARNLEFTADITDSYDILNNLLEQAESVYQSLFIYEDDNITINENASIYYDEELRSSADAVYEMMHGIIEKIDAETAGFDDIPLLTGTIKDLEDALAAYEYIVGDLDDDKIRTVGDVSRLVRMILDNYNQHNRTFRQADVNIDYDINVGDYSRLVDMVLSEVAMSKRFIGVAKAKGISTDIPVVTAETITICAGQKQRIAVNLVNNGGLFNAMQFDILLPEGITIVPDELETTRRSKGFYIIGRGQRVMLSNLQDIIFTDAQGDVAYITVEAEPNLPEGIYNIGIENIILSTDKYSVVKAEDTSAVLEVANPTAIGEVTDEADLQVSLKENKLTIKAAKAERVNIYSTDGKKITTFNINAGETKNISLPSGVYMVNSKKVRVR